MTMEYNNTPHLTDILKRVISAILIGVLTYAVVSLLGAAICIDNTCSSSVNEVATIVGGVTFAVTLLVTMLPVAANYLSDVHATRTTDYKRHAEAYHEQELKRIERERTEGLNKAEIERENAKTRLFVEMSKGVLNGTILPQTYLALSRGIEGGAVPKLPPAEVIKPPEQIAHWEYKLMNIGGFDSPVHGTNMKSGYLTCSLRSMKAAAQLALAGKQPSRGEFEAVGITGAEEAQECQRFLKDRGLLDPAFAQYRWHPRLDPTKLAKWVEGTVSDVSRRGGEAVFRKAAQQAQPKVEVIDADYEIKAE